jgi:hypothetical protein
MEVEIDRPITDIIESIQLKIKNLFQLIEDIVDKV